jgi:hypothetical protein
MADATPAASSTPNSSVNPNTQESIDSINSNMANVLDFQNQTQSAFSLWQARLAVNQKSWQLVDQSIQALTR